MDVIYHKKHQCGHKIINEFSAEIAAVRAWIVYLVFIIVLIVQILFINNRFIFDKTFFYMLAFFV